MPAQVFSPPAAPMQVSVLPAAPAEIPPQASVEQLKAIRSAWLRQAVEDGFPSALWTIASVLGRHDYRFGRDMWDVEWDAPAGRIRLRLMRSAAGYRPTAGCFYTWTSVSAVIVSLPERPVVAHFVWLHPEGETPRNEQLETDHCLFIPGQWTLQTARLFGRAIAAGCTQQERQAEEERRNLLNELLAGRAV